MTFSKGSSETMTTYVLGISCFYHDSAAALLADGEIVAAAQEERFTRVKHDSAFPRKAIDFCLKQAGTNIADVAGVYYYEDPRKKLARIFGTYLNFGLKGCVPFISDMPQWILHKLRMKSEIKSQLAHLASSESLPSIEYVPHHRSHAASAFYPSPFEEAAVLCIDGVGEWATTSAWHGRGSSLNPLWEIRFPHSLGLLYSAFTYFCGFKVDSGEYKLMGLAPYGKAIYRQKILDHLIDIKPDGSFWMDMDYFDYATGDTMVSERFAKLFGGPRREPESLLTQREFDLAASIQMVLEEVVIRLARTLRADTGVENLCLAGGVALNCVANGKLAKEGVFKSMWVQPAAGDAGGALGAAYCGWYADSSRKRAAGVTDRMRGSYLGTEYSDAEIAQSLDSVGAKYRRLEEEELPAELAGCLADGLIVGWFQGRMEYGPRALGARSILGDARNPRMQSIMNLKIKNRESFRPFAPAVIAEHANAWFDATGSSPYMLFVYPVQGHKRIPTTEADDRKQGIEKLLVPRSIIPAVTHVDHSARVQTVERQWNARFYDLIDAFRTRTGCPVVVNTSFNVRGEPIVESPLDAYKCFMRTAMDRLVVGNYLLEKTEQPDWEESIDWRTEYALD